MRWFWIVLMAWSRSLPNSSLFFCCALCVRILQPQFGNDYDLKQVILLQWLQEVSLQSSAFARNPLLHSAPCAVLVLGDTWRSHKNVILCLQTFVYPTWQIHDIFAKKCKNALRNYDFKMTMMTILDTNIALYAALLFQHHSATSVKQCL